MPRGRKVRTWRTVTRAAAVPGLDRALARAAPAVFRPSPGAKLARHWPMGVQLDLLDAYPRLTLPVLLLWADEDRLHPVAVAEDVLRRLPDGQLRVLDGTGFLMAYDDPVGVVRELVAFLR